MSELTDHEGVVLRLTEYGLGIAEDKNSHEQFAFTFDKIRGYRGEKPKELGLHIGSPIWFSATAGTGVVISVQLSKPLEVSKS